MFKDGKISEEETTFVKKCLDELVFEIIDGDLVNLNAYMEADPLTQSIYISSEWLTRAKNLSVDSLELKRHQHLLLIKCLHEIGNILTPLFMEKLHMKKTKQGYSTPTRIGTMKKGRKTIGEAGYGLEEILNGGRMFHERPKAFPAYHMEALVIEKVVDGKRKTFKINDSFLKRSKKRLESFQVKDNELIAIHREAFELFIPSYNDDFLHYHSYPSNPEVPYRRS
mmetsp:Transcript_14960/g.22113  ORF Transcript_14960/g.22113 Transcript_14960/m.22113 type:complete len:225 (-) Transcript_14960:51-725(-)